MKKLVQNLPFRFGQRFSGRFFLKFLRELSDEGAYRRYLDARGAVHTGAEWRKFSEHRLREKYSRAKCC